MKMKGKKREVNLEKRKISKKKNKRKEDKDIIEMKYN